MRLSKCEADAYCRDLLNTGDVAIAAVGLKTIEPPTTKLDGASVHFDGSLIMQ